jgi:hypothetical protein
MMYYVDAVMLFYLDGGSSEKQDVHQPAVNLAEVRKTAELREKMEILREKRRVQDSLRYISLPNHDTSLT